MRKVTLEIFEELKKSKLEKIDLLQEIQSITGEIVGRIFFGDEINKHKFRGKSIPRGLSDMITDTMSLMFDPFTIFLGEDFTNKGILPHHKSKLQAMKEFRELCNKIVQDRRKNRSEEDEEEDNFLGNLLKADVSDEMIVDNFVTFFLAGMDTTAHLIAMMIY